MCRGEVGNTLAVNSQGTLDTPSFPRYVGAQLHCHSSIEGPASIGAHCYEARRAGVEVVWLTDHDTRISLHIGGPFIDTFDFESPELATTVDRIRNGGKPGKIAVGWGETHRDPQYSGGAALSKETCYRGTQSLRLDGATDADEWQYFMLDFAAASKAHSRPLFSGARVGLAARLEEASGAEAGNAEAWLDLTLSEQPPDLKQARLRYFLVGDPQAHEPHAERDATYRIRPIGLRAPRGDWKRFELDPGADADWRAPDGHALGGIDNAMVGVRLTVRVRRGGRVRLFVDDLTISHEAAWNDLHARQKALAKKQAERYGVVCHVAQEISWAGQHKNAWGDTVPLLDYPQKLGGFTHDEGVAWATKHGGVFSLNHPFNQYSKDELSDAQREEALAKRIEGYIETQASGAHTLEVGFPAGRHGFPLDYYLRLWDGLSRAAVIVAGSGSSDAHSARVGWQKGNNFATHIRADSTDQEALQVGLRARNIYPADPVRFGSRLAFADDAGHTMGEVVRVDGPQERTASLTLESAKPQWRLVWVVNGERQKPVKLGEGLVTATQPVPVSGKEPAWLRAEIWDPSYAVDGEKLERPVDDPLQGRCLAFTNPIWYLPTG